MMDKQAQARIRLYLEAIAKVLSESVGAPFMAVLSVEVYEIHADERIETEMTRYVRHGDLMSVDEE